MKKKVSYCVDSYFDVDDRAVNLIKQLQELVEEHGDSVYLEKERAQYDDYREVVRVYVTRDETEEEYAERLRKEEVLSEVQKASDLAMLARLKAKYGEV